MSVQVMFACEHKDCEHWADRGPAGWLVVYERDSGSVFHYCSWECLMMDASTISAPFEFEAD